MRTVLVYTLHLVASALTTAGMLFALGPRRYTGVQLTLFTVFLVAFVLIQDSMGAWREGRRRRDE